MRKAFISPSKYVQGENELLNLGYFVTSFGKKALLIGNQSDIDRVRKQLDYTADKYQCSFIFAGFNGECSCNEIERLKKLAVTEQCDCTIGLGGGKAIDTAKCVAEGNAVIIVPTIAATDAPTSHSAVLYTEEGAFYDYAYFKQSPSVVLIDTQIIANAPVRFLVAGMGDALSTYFEARANQQSYANINAGLPCGVREGKCNGAKPTLAAYALATLCYQTLLKDGKKAKISCINKAVTPALENVIEANILLSGLGFESGGLAGAHAIHDGLTILDETHHYYHGEKVAFGTLVQLVLENASEQEIKEVLDFCLSINLPVCLEDIGVKNLTEEQLNAVANKIIIPEESIHAMPFPVTVESIKAAILTADNIGKNYKTLGKLIQ